MGSGNLNPDAIGNAPAAHLLVYSSSNANYNAVPNLYENDRLVITSKSYGNGQNDGYTTLARTLDDQCKELPALVHVFSAGNSGGSNFGYGAGAGWGNITGGHKQGKNVLAIGNVTSNDLLATSSSRGYQASDGRIKPDICAVGSAVLSTVDEHSYENKTGTSMACPGVAGSLALLYEAYREQNNDQDPDAALINAAILNTGEDLGNPGPDFRYGWGRINTGRANQLIHNKQYFNDSIEDDASKSFEIEVPEGMSELRVMVYWTDFRGSTSASKALVNDINMTLNGGGTTYEPWVLDPTPNATLLNTDAVRGTDDLNNMEQITVATPVAGTYTVNLDGFNIPLVSARVFLGL